MLGWTRSGAVIIAVALVGILPIAPTAMAECNSFDAETLLATNGVYVRLVSVRPEIWLEANDFPGLQYGPFHCDGRSIPGDQCIVFWVESMVSKCVAGLLA